MRASISLSISAMVISFWFILNLLEFLVNVFQSMWSSCVVLGCEWGELIINRLWCGNFVGRGHLIEKCQCWKRCSLVSYWCKWSYKWFNNCVARKDFWEWNRWSYFLVFFHKVCLTVETTADDIEFRSLCRPDRKGLF